MAVEERPATDRWAVVSYGGVYFCLSFTCAVSDQPCEEDRRGKRNSGGRRATEEKAVPMI